MNNKLTSYATAMLLAMGVMSASAQAADLEISNDIGVFSQYVWRGAPQGSGEASVQGDIGIATNGISFSLWYATLGQSNSMEYDLTLDYSGEAGDIAYSVGVLRYGFLHGAAPAVEFYAGGSFNIASATLYYDKDSKNIWIDAGVDLEAAGYAVSAGMGYALPDVGTSEVQIVTVGISKEFEIASGVSMSPSLTYNYALGANTTANGGAGDQLVAGVNFTY